MFSCNSNRFRNGPNCRVNDPLNTDHLARLHRIRSSLKQQVTTLDTYAKQFADLDAQQKALLKDIRDATTSLEKDAHACLDEAVPEIEEQNQIMKGVEERVERARTKLADQRDMVCLYRLRMLIKVGGN